MFCSIGLIKPMAVLKYMKFSQQNLKENKRSMIKLAISRSKRVN